MSDVAIRVEHLSKRYKLGEREPYKSLREVLARVATAPFSRLRGGNKPKGGDEYLLALDDVSFEVKQGEAVGIIGKNGAGKSTLLKVLSRITKPTKGKAEIYGRVGSLLEVGTGFHPELTGRENIYLNGAILGMKRSEIQRKFDEIVAFAEIEQFLDTPVKRYSSGMYVRLAFAVAAHLEPEILLVDEVLAVGDAEFQKKCLGKMGEVAQEGRTVLFVSHNMGAISQLCKTCILIDSGKITNIDEPSKVIKKYLNSKSNNSDNFETFVHHKGNGEIRIIWVQIQDKDGNPANTFSIGDTVLLSFKSKIQQNYQKQRIKYSIIIKSSDGIKLCNAVNSDSGFEIANTKEVNHLRVKFRDIRFYPDTYYISIWVGGVIGVDTYDYLEDCLSFDVTGGGITTNRPLPRSSGLLFLTPDWQEINN
jgi:lipopolysaccharide transport system ATP-binding protein